MAVKLGVVGGADLLVVAELFDGEVLVDADGGDEGRERADDRPGVRRVDVARRGLDENKPERIGARGDGGAG